MRVHGPAGVQKEDERGSSTAKVRRARRTISRPRSERPGGSSRAEVGPAAASGRGDKPPAAARGQASCQPGQQALHGHELLPRPLDLVEGSPPQQCLGTPTRLVALHRCGRRLAHRPRVGVPLQRPASGQGGRLARPAGEGFRRVPGLAVPEGAEEPVERREGRVRNAKRDPQGQAHLLAILEIDPPQGGGGIQLVPQAGADAIRPQRAAQPGQGQRNVSHGVDASLSGSRAPIKGRRSVEIRGQELVAELLPGGHTD